MKNVIVANFREGKTKSVKQYKKDQLLKELRVQIDNHLELGWNPKDLWVITNFPFVHNNIGAIQLPLNSNCLTGSKVFAMRSLFRHKMINDNIWIHDLDAWQNVKFDFPKIKHAGLAEYSRPKFNGGSMFYTPEAEDIIEAICKYLEDHGEAREEPTLDKLLRGEYADRTTIVNPGFNVGCSGFVKRWENSIKPIPVVHFHPTNRIAWDTHYRGRNGPKYRSLSDRLYNLFIKNYGNVISKFAYEDDQGPLNVRLEAVDREMAKKKGV
jgi:hypothetical protein